MDTSTLTEYQRHLLAWAKKDAKSRTQNWPGFPMNQVPLVSAPDVHKMVDMGYLELVHVTKPGPTGEVRTLTYVAPSKNA
jgi:hypothetical protein